jgi:hypothetical protein
MEENELFGEAHEQEENGLFGRRHEAEQLNLCGVVVPKGTLSCNSCKGTDLRQKDKNYYVCNRCGLTKST